MDGGENTTREIVFPAIELSLYVLLKIFVIIKVNGLKMVWLSVSPSFTNTECKVQSCVLLSTLLKSLRNSRILTVEKCGKLNKALVMGMKGLPWFDIVKHMS
uniref:Uncharacterized protein n=1 Tax=Glossina pallidipes TaxID=7398 RepID=A0A1A9ZIN4_GLOPL